MPAAFLAPRLWCDQERPVLYVLAGAAGRLILLLQSSAGKKPAGGEPYRAEDDPEAEEALKRG